MAVARVELHQQTRGQLTAHLRQIREEQAVIASRRDEAAARARRLAAHLGESEGLLGQSTELTTAAEAAQRDLDKRRGDLEAARDRLSLVEDQRVAAARAIEDAQSQLHDLESAELDEATLRRELERSGRELREAEVSHADATAAVETLQIRAGERAATSEQIAQERADLVARVEAPLYDPQPVRATVAALDAETSPEGDLVAQDLAREWDEVDNELARIEAALPQPPSDNDLSTAEHNLSELDNMIAEIEQTNRHARLPVAVRDQIEASHEAVLAAEEYLDQSGGHPQADAQLEAARVAEQQILVSYGYETYLDLVMTEPEPSDAQSEMMDVLRARRQAEDTLASLWAANEPPQIVLTLRARRERIFREAAELLCCDPGGNIADLLYAHPVVPSNRVRDLAGALASYGVYPIGVSVRDAALQFLMDLEEEVSVRDQYCGEIDRLDQEAVSLESEELHDNEEAHRLYDMVHLTADAVEAATARVQALERELIDRTAEDERRLQRVAAAEQLRAQIEAVTEALGRSDNEYHDGVAQAEAATTAAEAHLERATAALSDAVRKLRRISEALPPALRPKSSDDPLAELPRLREALASEVERAEVALTNATHDLERARADIDATQSELDAHLTMTPSSEVEPDDVYAAVSHLIGTDTEQLAVLGDPFADFGHDAARMELLDALAASSTYRPVVLLTDDIDTLSWAISLPDDVGMVTGLPSEPLAPTSVPMASDLALPDPAEAVAPTPSTS